MTSPELDVRASGVPETQRAAGRTSLRVVALSGLLTVGISYGFGRYGYGLFLPQIRREFHLSSATLGGIASAGYVGEVLALVAVAALAGRVAPRWLIAAGGLSAGFGMLMIGTAHTPALLLAGVALSGAAPGWVWAPYSDVVADLLAERVHGRALAIISTGTAFGVIVAGPAALLATGTRWHAAWIGFGIIALATTGWNVRVLAGARVTGPGERRPTRMSVRNRPGVSSLFCAAFFAGLFGAAYWAFAGDQASSQATGGIPTAPLLWTLIGVAGTAGVFTGELIRRRGLRFTYTVSQLALAAAALLLGLVAHSWLAAAASALLYGPSFMIVAAALSVWNSRVFPDQPARGFSITIGFLALGSVTGPAVLGVAADAYGLSATFAALAVAPLVALVARPARASRSAQSVRNRGESA
jgi:predicted MFS family arabinose efflux permease